MDTFFFILRKNNHQITVLHVYHHATMFNIWWFVMNWVPCGHSYFSATLNSFIHVLMYSYYGLSSVRSMRPYLWWKKYITQGQLVQFVLTIIQTSCGVI
ncbi:Elongation of very long chain fatty acids protein 5 [Sciurus carolinensis]|uniref:Elongation of very long chain fatty acids protein n=1 Tax=Sciurus carolinensis TaxID=30640 RepID=A0AA41N644_SCICA|nr:Elongation of very long chain fatty acids protein 5 [Sciurus carolinensis]